MTREVRGFNQIFSVFSKFNKNQIFFGQFVVVVIFSIHKPTLGSCPTQKFGPNGLAIWTSIGYNRTYKQTNKHPPTQSIYILGFQGTSRPYSISIEHFSLCKHGKTKTKPKKVTDFIKKSRIFKIL